MASSSENLVNLEPWMFRSTFADSWISEAFARDTDTLTRALQKSLSNNSEALTSDTTSMSPFMNIVNPSVSSVSGSDDPETVPNRRRLAPVSGSAGGRKITKRKSRASKQCMTTFIMADPANFRQMVQQVTGVRFGSSNLPAAEGILKPEPHRPGNRLQGCLPTLDTSEFLLDRFQLPEVSPGTSSVVGGEGHGSFTAGAVMGDGGAGVAFDSFSSFPTLESWKVM